MSILKNVITDCHKIVIEKNLFILQDIIINNNKNDKTQAEKSFII